MNIKKLIFSLLLNLILFNIVNSRNKSKTKKSTYNAINDLTHNKKDIKSLKRKLDDEELDISEFIPVKFYFDTINLKYELQNNEINNLISFENLIFESLNNAAKILGRFLTIYDMAAPACSKDFMTDVIELEVWDEEMINIEKGGDKYFSGNYTNIVWFKVQSMGNEIASSKIFLNEDSIGRPIAGIIYINADIDYSRYSQRYLETIMLRQLTHLLGFHKEASGLTDEQENFVGIIKMDSDNKYYVESSQVIAYAKKYFNCDDITKIEITIDEDGLPHWPSRILLGDYMADLIYPEEQVISGFTLAFFNDLGFLNVNYSYTGGLMRYGKHKGCKFIENKCIDYESDVLINKFENDFYYPNTDFENPEPSCSSGRLSKTVHKLHIYSEAEISILYRYFPSPHELYGGLPLTNFCPVSEYSSYTPETIYDGRCSNENVIIDIEKNIFGESRSGNSFCALNTFVKKPTTDYETYKNVVRAGCFKMYCSSESLTIQVGEDYLVCPKEGGKIQSDNYDGYILCPDFNLICTVAVGSDLCNNIFDCFDKKVEEKDNHLEYDYEIKTTQDSYVYKNQGFSEDDCSEQAETGGKCPQYCMQCKENRNCFKCKNSYSLVGTNEDDLTEALTCKHDINGYYSKNVNSLTVYYPCNLKIQNCLECSDSNTCTRCVDNYKVENGICKEIVENCEIYNNDNSCKKCKTNFDLIKVEETSCMAHNELTTQYENKYYYLVSGDPDYYVKCSFQKENCEKCEGENNCIECINNHNDKQFAIINDDHTVCKDLTTNQYFFDSSDNKYKPCSDKLSGCKTCSSNDNVLNCLECESADYVIVHGEKDECILKTTMENDNTKKYFKDDDGLNYYSCNNIRYHNVENCFACENREECLSCQSGFEIFNSNRLCVPYNDILKKKYYKINEQFYLCSEAIKGCEKCNSADECIECNIAFDLDENDKCIPTALSMTRYYKDPSSGKFVSCEKITGCEECSSASSCTKCKNGFELDNVSCKIKVKEENKENGDKDYDKLKALSTGAIILGAIGAIGSILAIILIFLKKLFFSTTVKPESTANNLNDDANDIIVQQKKHSIHNEIKIDSKEDN